MNLGLAARQVAVLKVLADAVAGRLAEVKAGLDAGFAETGTTQAPAVLPDGVKVATCSRAGAGGCSAAVCDPAALLAWVRAAHPSEVEEVIREEYRKKLLDTAKKAGRPVDPVTGQIIPGIVITPSAPYVSVRFTPGGREAITAAWQAGHLAGIGITSPSPVEGAA